MISLRPAAGTTLVLVLAAGCGGYEGVHPPVDGPGGFPTALQQSAAIPQDPSVQPTQVPTTGTPTTGASAPFSSAPTVETSSGGHACTLVGKISTVTVRVSGKIRRHVTSLRVTLAQGTLSRTAWTPIDPDHRHGMPLVRGVLITTAAYTFVLGGDGNPQAALPGAWNGAAKARLLVEALAGDGRTIYQRSVLFAFGTSYPNGKACDKEPALSFVTELTSKDQFSPLPRG